MTLIESMMSQCTRLTRSTVSDGHMGRTVTYTDGESFMAAVIKNAQREQTTAEKADVSELYTVVIPTGTALGHHDVFRRESDGAVFRITGNVRDNAAPVQSTVQIAKVPAERWDLEC